MNPILQYADPAPLPRTKVIKLGGGFLAQGRFKVQVIERGRIVQDRPWQKNMILDQGLNNVMQTVDWTQLFTACAAGTGNTPINTDSGVITIDYNVTTPGGHATASAPFFAVGMVGMLIQLDTGEQAYITAFNSNIDVTISNLTVVAASIGTVWAVNQTGLTTEAKRSTTYLIGAGNCGTSDVGNVRTMRRTYEFTAEVGNVNYAELGWSDNGAAGANLNMRALIAGGTVTVLIGQQLRVIYDFALTVTPNASTPGTYAITGWPVAPSVNTDGDYQLTNPFNGGGGAAGCIGNVNVNGVATQSGGLSPYRTLNGSLRISTATVMPAFGNNFAAGGTTAQNNSAAMVAYTLGSFNRTKQYTFDLGTGNRTDWRAACVEDAGGSNGWVFIFDQNQTKDNAHTLRIDVNIAVGRVLVNP